MSMERNAKASNRKMGSEIQLDGQLGDSRIARGVVLAEVLPQELGGPGEPTRIGSDSRTFFA
jgi:hypothetical protein